MNYRAAMVEFIEKTYDLGAGRGQIENLVTFFEDARNQDYIRVKRNGREVHTNTGVAPLIAQPGSFATLLGFISTEVVYLGQASSPILTSSRSAAANEAARLIKSLNGQLRSLVAIMTKAKPWCMQPHTVDVVRVWRDRMDEMIGTPEARKLAQDNIPNRKANYVLVQGESGATHPYLCVTDDMYSPDAESGKDYRQDFLIDVCKYIESVLDTPDSGGFTRDVKPAYKMGIVLENFMEEFVDFFDAANSLVRLLQAEGVDTVDPEGLYDIGVGMAEALKGGVVSAEENPDAKYTIGEFA